LPNAKILLNYLAQSLRREGAAVLVTVTAVIGSASRATGAHMVVCESGDYQGSFSGGCIEAAVAAEALRILATGKAEVIRFGLGSRFIDIRLPCGGGLDLLFTPIWDADTVEDARDMLEQRQPVALLLGLNGSMAVERASTEHRTGWEAEAFVARHDPPLRLILIGQGEEVEQASVLALAFGAEIVVLSPDAAVVSRVNMTGAVTHHLKTPAATPLLAADAWTAVLLLFHDHDWEIELMTQALSQPAFFIGAMGSPGTAATRLETLRARGISEAQLARIMGPVGLIPATRDPATLALSALAQIVAAYANATEPSA
jgi:xanthine dehydrogenase accessory factor